jgi:hypothetical protein
MSDERLERLTELARKAWPAVLHARVRAAYADRHEVTVETADYHRMRLMVDHPRALDALESALRVLANEPVGDLVWLESLDEERARTASLLRDLDAERARVDAQGEHNAITHACWVADRNRANAAEARLAELTDVPDLSACAAGGSRDVLREFAFRLVERELRARELSVCKLDSSGIVSTHDSYEPAWEGEAQDGWSLLQALDALEKTP